MFSKKPSLYIRWFTDGEPVIRGPYHTISFDGYDILEHKWVAYEVQTASLTFERITVPKSHYISSQGNEMEDENTEYQSCPIQPIEVHVSDKEFEMLCLEPNISFRLSKVEDDNIIFSRYEDYVAAMEKLGRNI